MISPILMFATGPFHTKFMAWLMNVCRFAALVQRHFREPTMRKNLMLAISIAALALPLAGCNDPQDTATAEQSYGASPNLPAPQQSRIPTVNIATATSWPAGAKPKAANGMAVNAFATGLEHPRTVYVLPNGDVLVAESNAPPTQGGMKGIKGFVYGQVQKWAGAAVPSPTVSRCCAMPTATGWPRHAASCSAH